MTPELLDQYQRPITYLRLSVTDRCNLRCRYCMPSGIHTFTPHEDILRYEEMIRLVGLFARLGITKVRITGGEPLVRKGVVHLISEVAAIPGIEDVVLTSNAVLLDSYAHAIAAAGVNRVNISLDSLNRDTYLRITGKDLLPQVLKGISTAMDAGLTPIKLNAVLQEGVNDSELEALAGLSMDRDIHVRFIEEMPVGGFITRGAPIFGDTVLSRLTSAFGRPEEIPSQSSDGPARRFKLPGATGEVGLISAMSRHFCDTCNRIRLTADGLLRTCLFSDTAADLKTPMRQGASDSELCDLIYNSVYHKPARHGQDAGSRSMNAIGG